MISHAVRWYEADDGEIFVDEMECLEYEVNLLYQKSGVRFFKGDEEIIQIITEDDRTYNEMTDICIDRSKKDENDAFREALYSGYGWCLVDDALAGEGSHYRVVDDSVREIKDRSKGG